MLDVEEEKEEVTSADKASKEFCTLLKIFLFDVFLTLVVLVLALVVLALLAAVAAIKFWLIIVSCHSQSPDEMYFI